MPNIWRRSLRFSMPTKSARPRTPSLTGYSSPKEDLEMGNDSKEPAPTNKEIGVEDSSTQALEVKKNDLITFASIKEILDKEENLEYQPECYIFRVPKQLRKMNEEAYTPEVISIGPLHYGNQELSVMEIQKKRYLKEFNKRIIVEVWQEIIDFIEKNEQNIRNCYSDMPISDKLKFKIIILHDAVFIIEYLLRCYNNDEAVRDFLINNQVASASILRDFQLLENQLPFFVLNGLYELAEKGGKFKYSCFLSLSAKFFKLKLLGKQLFLHFTDMKRYDMTKMKHAEQRLRDADGNKHPVVKPQESGGKFDRNMHRVVKLHESGVKFKPFQEGECLLDIKFEKKNWIPCLKLEVHPELKIPQIEIYDDTESLIRNVMALEQCHYPSDTLVCDYIDLMDSLINTEEDVNLLVEAGIISNCVGDTAKIAKMFNQLCSCIICSGSRYNDVVKNLKAHYANPWNHAKATLKRVYFSNPWRGTGTVAAIVLLLLTLIQTVCSIISVV